MKKIKINTSKLRLTRATLLPLDLTQVAGGFSELETCGGSCRCETRWMDGCRNTYRICDGW